MAAPSPTGASRGRRRPSWPRRAGAAAAAALLLGGAGYGAWWASEEGLGPRLGPAACHVVGDDGARHRLTADRAALAGVITAVALERDLAPRAATIGIATGIQESGLRNLDHGDAAGPDSRGVFQQRPSQGWGTQEEVMDPVYAANAFYAELESLVPEYQDVPVTEAAQRVQRSAYPDAYADHEAEARAWAAALTGQRTETLRCRLDAPEEADPEGFAAAAERQRPSGPAWTRESEAGAEGAAVLTAGADGSLSGQEARAAAAWAVVMADGHGARRVEVGETVWDRAGRGGWQSRADAGLDTPAPTGVRVTF